MKHASMDDDELAAALAVDLREIPVIVPDPISFKRMCSGTPSEIRTACADWLEEVKAHLASYNASIDRHITITVHIT